MLLEALLSDFASLPSGTDDLLLGDTLTSIPYLPFGDVYDTVGYLSSRCGRGFDIYTMDQTIVEQEDVLRGVTDIQGLSWRPGPENRNEYLLLRKDQRSYNRSNHDHAFIQRTARYVDYSETYYDFRYTDTTQHCSHGHFQLRNLVSMTSKNDVYYINNNAVMQWSPQRRQSRTLLANRHVPYRITAMTARDDCLLAAGEDGEFALLNLRTCAPPLQGSLTDGKHVEVNSIEMSTSRSGAFHAYITTNDHIVRNIDLGTMNVLATFPAEWFANYASQSPDKHMICVVGDHNDAKVFSVNSREQIATLVGHKLYSFACAWSPDGRLVATGSDDMTVLMYDTRRMDEPLFMLMNDIHSSVRSLRFSDDGRFLYLGEDTDCVKIVDASSDYTKGQSIEFIGDVTGIAVASPGAEGLFIGTSGKPFSSLLEFERSTTSDDDYQDDPFWP
ncbi:hypothetical protein DFQ26_007823 [Actinomortierella ambigua]|nr:hypothetical protein DFQ26_007823 [Actinomortierella ambigua]